MPLSVKYDRPVSGHDRSMRVQAVIAVRGCVASRIGSGDHLRTQRDTADVHIAVVPLAAAPIPGIIDEAHLDMVGPIGIEIPEDGDVLPLRVGVHRRHGLRSTDLAPIHKNLDLRVAGIVIARHVQAERPGCG